ncbi:MAG TPA: hypothetical protein VLE22_00270 [Bryobacteraceae bacterium]|nr:hypothetical protein [Bryobacteraceae bacterium]
MRTTVTLDPDVERLVRAAMRARGLSFKQALNQAVRVGLSSARTSRGRRFAQKTYSLGPEQNFRWDKALAAAEALEDEDLSRKLSLRK